MTDLESKVDIETPEQIALSYSVAGIGSRAVAAMIDYLILFGTFIVLIILAQITIGVTAAPLRRLGVNGFSAAAWAFAILVLIQFVLMWGYHVLFEGLNDGQTPGKRIMKLRVVSDGGYSVSFAASAVRNLLRLFDAQPFPFYFVGIATAMLNRSGKRLGDLVAGTFVVKEGAALQQLPELSSSASAVNSAGDRPLVTRLTDLEYGVLERFISRRQLLDPERRRTLAQQLVTRFVKSVPELATAERATGRNANSSAGAALLKLFEQERDARKSGVAARSDTGAQREQHAIVALGMKRWNQFANTLATTRKRGLHKMPPEDVSVFVAQYRELSTDLARLQTAARGRSSDSLFYVSRLVASGHSLLYRQKRESFAAVMRYITDTVPGEIRRSWVPIAVATVLLFGPLITAYTAIVRSPSIAPSLLPEEMLHRARTGSEREQRGEGYITVSKQMQPVLASNIMVNNIQVTYLAFILGITAGVGTLLLLVFNGVSIGSAIGLFASYDVAHLILAFIAPHGVLELTAICIAGGGGLLIASSFFLPGPRTRREALIENGKRAITLIAGSTLLLIVAGAIEGLISPRVWPMTWKLAVSGATAIGLIGYLSLGWRTLPRQMQQKQQASSAD